MHCPDWASDILDAGYFGQIGKTIVLAYVLNQNGGLTGKASVNCAIQVTKTNAGLNRSNVLMGILTDLATRLA